jgi:hypothetical protein
MISGVRGEWAVDISCIVHMSAAINGKLIEGKRALLLGFNACE